MERTHTRRETAEDHTSTLIAQLRGRAEELYRGQRLAKRSSSVSIAETFGRRVTPYHGLTKGGYVGEGECGAIVAGRLVLAEFLSDSDPKECLTGQLAQAGQEYQQKIQRRIQAQGSPDFICNSLTAPFEAYDDPERHAFCCHVVSEVAAIVAEILLAHNKLEGAIPDSEG